MNLSPNSRPIDRSLAQEWETGDWYKTIFRKIKRYSVKTVLDIGANVGISAYQFNEHLHPDRIYCVEPDAENIKLLVENCEDFLEKITIFPVGIYYGKEKAQVYGVGDNNPGGYMVEGVPCGTIQIPYKNKTFRLSPLEKFFSKTHSFDLIKIDVEGAEFNIIEHSPIIKNSKLLLISLHGKWSWKEYLDSIMPYLENYKEICRSPEPYFPEILLRKETK